MVRKKSKKKDDEFAIGYIAHDVKNPRAFDEIFKVIMAYDNQSSPAIFGPPGSGKTLLVESAAKLIGKEVETITCAPESTVEDIVGGYVPSMAKDEKGKVIPGILLELKLGALGRAMKEGKICMFDEANKLSRDVQSYLAGPLDFRRNLKTTSGEVIVDEPKEGFMSVFTWNPGKEHGGEEFLGFIKDRINYKPFEELPIDMQVRIVLGKYELVPEEKLSDENMQERAIVKNEETGMHELFIKKGDVFVHIIDNKKTIKASDPRLKKYRCYIGGKDTKLKLDDENSQDLYDNLYTLTTFLKTTNKLVLEGTKGVTDETVKNSLQAMHLGSQEALHEAYHIEPRSGRVLEDLGKMFDYCLKQNMPPEMMTEMIGDMLMDNMIQASGDVPLGRDMTWKKLVKTLGQLYHLKFKGEEYSLSPQEGLAEIGEEEK